MIEVLIVVALFSIIGVSLFQSFSMGLKIWKMASRPNFSYRKAVLGLERLARDLRHVRAYPNASFTGSDDSVSFVSVVYGKAYNISYDFGSGVLRRSAEVLDGTLGSPGAPREVVPDVREVGFSYMGYDIPSGGFVLFDDWDGTVKGYPLLVRVKMDLEDDTHLEKTTYLPISQ